MDAGKGGVLMGKPPVLDRMGLKVMTRDISVSASTSGAARHTKVTLAAPPFEIETQGDWKRHD